MKTINKSQRFQISISAILLLFILSGIFPALTSFKITVSAETQNIDSFSNPLVILDIPGEIQAEFQTGIYVGAESDFQVGEKIMILLRIKQLKTGSFPAIAENTIFQISNSTNDIIWTKNLGSIGKCEASSPGGMSERGVNWIPDKADNYAARIIFEQPNYENLNDNNNTVPFRVHKPGPFYGKITEIDQLTAISGALVEALINNEIKSNTTTNNVGLFHLEVETSGTYDIRISKPEYISSVQNGFKTELKAINTNFSLVPLTLSPNFGLVWHTNITDSQSLSIDSQKNMIIASRNNGSTILSKLDPDGNLLWNISEQFSGAWESPSGVAVDSSDNILLLSKIFQGNCYNLWTFKFDPQGNQIWKQCFDSGGSDHSTNIAVDSFDNVFVIGSVHGNNTSTLVKYTLEGVIVWSKTLPAYFETGELVVDKNNNIILGGSTSSPSLGNCYYVAKLDSTGDLVWEKLLKSNSDLSNYGYGVALDSIDNIIVTGDRFTVKFDQAGNEIWSKYFSGKDLVVDNHDNIILIGGSSVTMFTSYGQFLGNVTLTEVLNVIGFDQNDVIVGGNKDLLRICLEGNSTQIEDLIHLTQPSHDIKVPLDSTIKTSAHIKLEPKTTEVDKEVTVNMILEPTPLTTEYFEGLVLIIVDPTGHTYFKGPYSTNANGTQNISYIPKITGNYTFQLKYPGQTFNDQESEYTSSISPIVTLTVKGQPETIESSDSVQHQANTTSTTIETISIQSSSDETLLNSTVSSASVKESSFIPTQTSYITQIALPSTLEIAGTVLVVIFGIGLLVNLVKKRRP